MASALRHSIIALSLISLIAVVSVAVSLNSSQAGAVSKAATYPRSESLVTGGTQWADIQGFNPWFGNYAVGTVGLCYETLLRYDPLKDRYINWLAKSARFTSKRVYTVKLRPGIKWSNGQKLTGRDVAFNYRLGRFGNAFWHDLYVGLKSIKVRGLKVTFSFKGTPHHIQWQNLIWNLPLVNPAQAHAITSAAALRSFGKQTPIGTGPYVLDPAGYDPTTRVVWKKKAVWWAAKQGLSPPPQPKFVIDIVSSSCIWGGPECGVIPGLEDLENTYLTGIQNFVKRGNAQTYFPGDPYHLSANTAWLEVNTTKPALNDRQFRRALATSINIGQIIADDYEHLVPPANATGLLPTWKKWVDQKQLKALGFTYSIDKAKSLLATAGYRDVNGDGYVENKNGSVLDLKLAVPAGWSDWEAARNMIIASAGKAGIRLHKDEGDYNHWQSERNSGAFDLLIDNAYQLSDNPWTYFNGIFHLPLLKEQTFANFGRYQNVSAWKLVQQLDKTPAKATAKRRALMKKLEQIELTELPIIPLWYGGIWAQSQSRNWTNWPSSNSKRNYTPTMWRGYMQMTAIDMITHLKEA